MIGSFQPASPSVGRDASVETIDEQSSGTLGYEIGTYTLTVNGPNCEAVKESGRCIELLKRGPDGKWYSTAGIWNVSPGSTQPQARP